MLPDWMTETKYTSNINGKNEYIPPKGNSGFVVKSLRTLGGIMSRLKITDGREDKRSIPAVFKLFLVLIYIVVLSVTHERVVILVLAAAALMIIAFKPAYVIWEVLKPALLAGLLTAVLFVPAVILNIGILGNCMRVVIKVILSVSMLILFNRTTAWNHITAALRKLRLPGIFIFILDITLRYIVLMGNFMGELLTALSLRSVGTNNRKYNSVGGVMGVTFIRGTEMNREMYEAMRCRCFTDDYDV